MQGFVICVAQEGGGPFKPINGSLGLSEATIFDWAAKLLF